MTHGSICPFLLTKKKKILKIESCALKTQQLNDYQSQNFTGAFNERQIRQLSLLKSCQSNKYRVFYLNSLHIKTSIKDLSKHYL